MSWPQYDRWVESCEDALASKPMDHLYENEGALADFVMFLEKSMHPEQFGQLINTWLESPSGKIWYEAQLAKMIADGPATNDDNPRED